MRASLLTALGLPVALLVACGGSEFESSGGTGGSSAGSGTAGSGTAGTGTAGSATAGTAGTGTAGTGTAGTGTAGAAGAGGGMIVDMSGNYSVTTTNGSDTCGSANWMEGAVNKDIPFNVTQKNADLAAVVGGWAGVGQTLLLGNSAPLIGTITGDQFTMKAVGDVKKDKTCESFWTATATGKVMGDSIQGTYVFSRTITMSTPDCAMQMVTECNQSFTFAGVRPPKGI